MSSSCENNRNVRAIAALVFLIAAGVSFASAQTAKPAPAGSDDVRLMQYLDKNGGYRDSFGGYYNPSAGTYTDEKGGVLDNWRGYIYKDGSYKSKIGDYWDAPTKTFKLANGEVVKSPETTNTDAITVLRQSVEENGGFDKNFIQRAMLGQIQKDHPIVPNKVVRSAPSVVSGDEAKLMKFDDKNGGYLDRLGGYSDPRAGTYTDKEGGVVDNWKGYTYKDGSYKSALGDYWDASTKTFKLAYGTVASRPSLPNADAIKALRKNVEQNGGYDKDFIRNGMLESIRKEHQ
jgi:hypothetical protein